MNRNNSAFSLDSRKEPRCSVDSVPESSANNSTFESRHEAFDCDVRDMASHGSDSLEGISENTLALNQLVFEEEHARLRAGLNPFMSFRHNSARDSAAFDALNQQRMILQLLQRSQSTQSLARSNYNELHDRAAAASVAMRRSSTGRTAYVWTGELPPRNYTHPVFSCKIFVGGVPFDITEDNLLDAFSPYGECRVEWPGREARFNRSRQTPRGKVTGYVYIIFEQERSVRSLLHDCSQEYGSAGEWYFKLQARRYKTTEIRQVQVIPWVVSDATYVEDPSCRLDPKKTVFVGALHGMITAQVLFSIMNELYGNVVFVGIDTDKYKYPIGSGRVTFSCHTSYFRAIESAFLEIKTSKFSKKVQIDPFLEETVCMTCDGAPGPYFCRDRQCFRYYCFACWQARHSPHSPFADHRALTRNAPRAALLPGSDNPDWLHDSASLCPRGLGMGYCGRIPGVRAGFEGFSCAPGLGVRPAPPMQHVPRRTPWLNINPGGHPNPLSPTARPSDADSLSSAGGAPRSPWSDFMTASSNSVPPSPTGSSAFNFPPDSRPNHSLFGPRY